MRVGKVHVLGGIRNHRRESFLGMCYGPAAARASVSAPGRETLGRVIARPAPKVHSWK